MLPVRLPLKNSKTNRDDKYVPGFQDKAACSLPLVAWFQKLVRRD